jgi:hypothetical protein
MKTTRSTPVMKYLAVILAAGILVTAAAVVSRANDWIAGELRVDLPEVYTALDYRARLMARDIAAANPGEYTTVWLAVDLDNQPGLFGADFTQVGLMTDNRGVFWFVYSEPGVTCDRGTVWWPGQCEGGSDCGLGGLLVIWFHWTHGTGSSW